ncbi:hypothetical protein AB0M02_22490 [Actinoplanes sp. NPDC051861]|uniref:type VII secretion target n=1 Tax=Actinoplanes sp. NPDC051861 TaxID=3155170 RepID=UPI00343CFA09
MTAHIDTVSTTADAVRTARAAASTAINPDAYGQLCGFLPAVLNVVFEAAVVALNGSAEALEETALNLRAAVSTLEQTDVAAARSLGGPP